MPSGTPIIENCFFPIRYSFRETILLLSSFFSTVLFPAILPKHKENDSGGSKTVACAAAPSSSSSFSQSVIVEASWHRPGNQFLLATARSHKANDFLADKSYFKDENFVIPSSDLPSFGGVDGQLAEPETAALLVVWDLLEEQMN